ncbi:hypothetical protein N7537_007763 [Penicillium hordei]|uniref:Uncharacterized protein n=1 Tax=Penicillium hordei TaxID=40994 RepID=A0AAD6H082_9EURO|nr:uncharacterized protein N7537_007763 [Penicillium hordei]KAJ5597679.1 hypothetical protein N7537_007763 [Penicillium hordei]
MYAFLVELKPFHFTLIKIRLTARFTCPMQNDVCAVAPRLPLCPSAPRIWYEGHSNFQFWKVVLSLGFKNIRAVLAYAPSRFDKP